MCETVSHPTLQDEAASLCEEEEGGEGAEWVEDPVSNEDTGGEESESAKCADAVEGEKEEDDEGAKSKKSHRIQGLYKPPTRDELQTLKETQNLFNSNLMKLQVSIFGHGELLCIKATIILR